MYDVVIIGSGLGGLGCGLILSKEGYKVCVLEKNRQIGGSLQIFSRDKAIFDTGIHYIGGLNPGQNLHQIFKYFNILDSIKLQKMDENGFDRIFLKNDLNEYPHAQGYDNFVEQLVKYFPKERDNIRAYVQEIERICNAFPMYHLRDEPSDILNTSMLSLNAREAIDSFTDNYKLQQVLAGTNVLYAGVAEKTPFYVHALVVNSYIESAWRCVDGSGQIAKAMVKRIKENGGDVFNYSQATKFHFNGSEISEVELSNGERIQGKTFISNVDLSRTMDLIEEGFIRPAYRKRLHSLENTTSAFLLNVVLKPESMQKINYNTYFYQTDDVWDNVNYDPQTWPPSVAMFSPETSRHNGYAETVTLLTYMHYEEMKKWEHTFRTIPKDIESRGDDYEEFKAEKAEKLIDLYCRKDPDFRSRIKSYSCSTPLTYRDYIGSRDGTLYGVLKSAKDPLKTFINTKTKIPNLYITGQNMNSHGVLGVSINAIKTCSEFVGQSYLLQKINKA